MSERTTRAAGAAAIAAEAERRARLADIAVRWVEARHHKAGTDRSVVGETDDDLDDRVKHALDMATIACCEHIARVMSADAP